MISQQHPQATQRLTSPVARIASLAIAAALVACGGSDDYTPPNIAPPPPASTEPGSLTGRILSASDGQPVAGASISAGGVSATTAADGTYTLAGLAASDNLQVDVSASGYARNSRFATVRNGMATTLPVQMLPVATAVSIDAAAGGTVTVAGSTAQVVIPAAAIVTGAGGAPTQPVIVQLTPVNPAQDPNLVTGDFRTTSAGATSWLESFGGLSVVLTDASGGSYGFASGQSATIRIPASSRSATLPASAALYWFDEAAGAWVQEGTATLSGTAPNQYYEGSVSRSAIWSVDASVSTVQVTGCVRDSNGARVVGARVEADGVNYSGTSHTVTNSLGNFTLTMRRDASAAVMARWGSRMTNARAVTTVASNVNMGTECLVVGNAVVTIKLTWGARPADVDSHLLTPHGTHVYWDAQGSLASAPFANLDIDDVTSFGPEIISIRRLAQGTYRYYLDNFSQAYGPGMTESPVKVELTYDGVTSVYLPGPGEGTLRRWHAFDMVVDSQCNVTITPADAWMAGEPANPNAAGAVTYCN